jgi:hypothetical protein
VDSLLFYFNSSVDGNKETGGVLTTYLKRLEGSLKWEIRFLFLIIAPIAFFFIYKPVALILGSISVLVVLTMVCDFAFYYPLTYP